MCIIIIIFLKPFSLAASQTTNSGNIQIQQY